MPATTALVGMPGEWRGPGYAGCIVNAEATLPRAQTAAPRPRRPLPAVILKWFGIACLMVAAGLGGYIGWLLWGTGLTTKAAQNELKHDFTQVIDTKDPAQAPPAGVEPLRASAYAELVIPRIDLDLIVVQGTDRSRSRRGRGTIPIPPTPGTPRDGSASPATAPRTSPRSTAWTRCRWATRSRCGPSTGRSTIT